MQNKRRAWQVMWVIFISGIAIATNMFKVPPLMQILMADLEVDMTTGGWLMSVYSLATVLLSLPAAMLLTRFGVRRIGLLALASTFTGAVIGALAPNATVLLVARVIEGIGSALITIMAPLAIALWFPAKERGLPMSIWSAWVPVANVIMFNSAYGLQELLGWRGVWFFGAALVAAAAVLYIIWVDSPKGSEEKGASFAPLLREGIGNRQAWLLGLAFATFSFGIMSYNTWAPTYLTDTLNLSTPRASFFASLVFAGGIGGNLLAGWLMGRVRDRLKLLLAAFAGNVLLMTLGFRLASTGIIAPYMISLGLVSNIIPAVIFTLAPEIASRPALAGLTMAMVTVQSNTASLIGPPILGALVSRNGWQAGGVLLPSVLVLGTLIALLLVRQQAVRDQSTVVQTS